MTIGILPLGRPTFDVEFANEKLAAMLARLDATGRGFAGPRDLLFDADATRTAIAELKQAGISSLLVLQVTFTDASMTVEAASAFGDLPLAIWAVPEPRIGGRLRLNAFCGLNLASHALGLNGRSFSWLYADPENATDDDIAALLDGRLPSGHLEGSPVDTNTEPGSAIVESIKGRRIGRIGEHPAGFDTCAYSADKLSALAGVTVDEIGLDTLFDTARNSADTAQMFLPGYRDRIVHIAMQEHEGGLNLDMPQEIIEALGMRGELAGRLLTERFAPDVHVETRTGEPIALDWNNHRWVRYRMFMASLEATVRAFATRWQNDAQNADRLPPGYLTLKDLLERSRDRIGRENLGWYSEEQWLHARANTESLVAAVSTWQSPHDTFDATVDEHGQPIAIGGAPEPRPLLRVVPPDEISAPSVASQTPGHQQMPPSRMPEPRR